MLRLRCKIKVCCRLFNLSVFSLLVPDRIISEWTILENRGLGRTNEIFGVQRKGKSKMDIF